MTGSTLGNWVAYSRWVRNIGRNAHITNYIGTAPIPFPGEITIVRYFLKLIWNPQTQTGTRPWLQAKFQRLATNCTATAHYNLDIDNEPIWVLNKLVEVVGYDLKKIPMTDIEKFLADILIVYTNGRDLGIHPYYGSVIGNA